VSDLTAHVPTELADPRDPPVSITYSSAGGLWLYKETRTHHYADGSTRCWSRVGDGDGDGDGPWRGEIVAGDTIKIVGTRFDGTFKVTEAQPAYGLADSASLSAERVPDETP
jgi:hypothetical protein